MPNSLSVSAQTRINAPVEKAWQVLTDFGSYHTWHPILTLEPHAGPLAVGTLLQGQSSGGPAGEQPVAFTIARVQEPNHLAWTGGDPEVVAGRHSFQLEQLADGTTEFIESEVFTGPAAPEVIGGQLPELHAAYETLAAAFKKRVEEGVQLKLPIALTGKPRQPPPPAAVRALPDAPRNSPWPWPATTPSWARRKPRLVRGARLADRGVTLAEFEDYLRTVNNRDGHPYEGANINACVAPARTWMHG